jgi:hypothetical protein
LATTAEVIAAILTALGDFGAKLDKLGPIAIAGVFTVLFAVLTFLAACFTRSII